MAQCQVRHSRRPHQICQIGERHTELCKQINYGMSIQLGRRTNAGRGTGSHNIHTSATVKGIDAFRQHWQEEQAAQRHEYESDRGSQRLHDEHVSLEGSRAGVSSSGSQDRMQYELHALDRTEVVSRRSKTKRKMCDLKGETFPETAEASRHTAVRSGEEQGFPNLNQDPDESVGRKPERTESGWEHTKADAIFRNLCIEHHQVCQPCEGHALMRQQLNRRMRQRFGQRNRGQQ